MFNLRGMISHYAKKRQNKMSRKAQISVFIVIALLIVGAIIIVYAFRERISSVINAGKGDASIEISEINSVIESCAEQRAIDAIRLIGLQGGYVNLLENYLSTNISNIAYGYYNGKKMNLVSKWRINPDGTKTLGTAIVDKAPSGFRTPKTERYSTGDFVDRLPIYRIIIYMFQKRIYINLMVFCTYLV